MNQYSRDALRREHHLFVYEDRMTGDDVEACDVCGDGYPCDVIFVLDAWEAEKPQENESAPKYYRWDDAKQLTGIMPVFEAYERGEPINLGNGATLVKCDHADWTSNAYSEDIYADMGYHYCPKCGEKL